MTQSIINDPEPFLEKFKTLSLNPKLAEDYQHVYEHQHENYYEHENSSLSNNLTLNSTLDVDVRNNFDHINLSFLSNHAENSSKLNIQRLKKIKDKENIFFFFQHLNKLNI